MRSRKFYFVNKDISYLKKNTAKRIIFSLVFLAIFIWQFASMIISYKNNSLNTIKIIVSIITLLPTLLLAFVSFIYAFINLRVISAIRTNGRCLRPVNILISTEKKSALKISSILLYLIYLACTIVLGASLTYCVLDAVFLSNVSYYLPFLFSICFSGYNSIFHIKDELYIQKNIEAQSPLY